MDGKYGVLYKSREDQGFSKYFSNRKCLRTRYTEGGEARRRPL